MKTGSGETMKILLTALCAMLLLGPGNPARAGETAQRALDSETLRCGYAEWTPVFYRDIDSGEFKGIAHDVMEEIGRKTGLRIQWTENAGWGMIAEGVGTRYDMACVTLGMMATRARAIGFSQPVFYIPVYPVVRADDARFDANLDLLQDPRSKIGVLEGEGSALIAAERYPKATTIAIPQSADYTLLMEDIKAKKSDISFITAETFDSFDKKQPGIFKIAQRGKPVSVIAAGFGLPRDDMAFKTLIDTALTELQNEGRLDEILDRYDTGGRIFLRPPKPYVLPQESPEK